MNKALIAPPNDPIAEVGQDNRLHATWGWRKWFAVLAAELFQQRVYSVTIDPPSIPANSTVSVDVPVPGLVVGQVVTVNRQAAESSVGIGNAWVSAADTLTVEFFNVAGGAGTDPAQQTFLVHAI